MTPLYTQEQYDNATYKDLLPCKCEQCKESFLKPKEKITYEIKHNQGRLKFCSNTCQNLFRKKKILVKCECCGIDTEKTPSQIKNSKHNFCSKSCSNLFQKTKIIIQCEYCGVESEKYPSYIKRSEHSFCSNSCSVRYYALGKPALKVSKLERYIQEYLNTTYPELGVLYNYRDHVFSELDIYIPKLNLAVEINGLGHYEPIYGVYSFNRTQYNDALKVQRCTESGISLLVIDTSKQIRFTPETSAPYLSQVISVIESALQEKCA